MMYYIGLILLFVVMLFIVKRKEIVGLATRIRLDDRVRIDDLGIYSALYTILNGSKEVIGRYAKIILSIENEKAKPYILMLLRKRKLKLEYIESKDGNKYIALLSVIDSNDNGIRIIPVYIETVNNITYINIDDVYVCLNHKLESATSFNLLSNDVKEIVVLDALDDSISMVIDGRSVEIYGDSDYNMILKYELGVKQW